MKLPFTFSISGGSNSYHDSTFDQDEFDAENRAEDDNGNDGVENFEEYLWMENEEEFDKNELQRLEEEALITECMENMQEECLIQAYTSEEALDGESLHWHAQNESVQDESSNGDLSKLELTRHDIEKSTLNPLAQEFVPSSTRLK